MSHLDSCILSTSLEQEGKISWSHPRGPIKKRSNSNPTPPSLPPFLPANVVPTTSAWSIATHNPNPPYPAPKGPHAHTDAATPAPQTHDEGPSRPTSAAHGRPYGSWPGRTGHAKSQPCIADRTRRTASAPGPGAPSRRDDGAYWPSCGLFLLLIRVGKGEEGRVSVREGGEGGEGREGREGGREGGRGTKYLQFRRKAMEGMVTL